MLKISRGLKIFMKDDPRLLFYTKGERNVLHKVYKQHVCTTHYKSAVRLPFFLSTSI